MAQTKSGRINVKLLYSPIMELRSKERMMS
jgi:hypothetical protein